MTLNAIAAARLVNQYIACEGHPRPEDVVAWFGAVQAQEYEPAKWGLGLRMHAGTRNADVERAFERGAILRTHVMRPTWHFVTARDIRWLLELTGPRVQRSLSQYSRRLELDARTLARALRVVERALGGRQYLTRLELAERLQRANITATGQRLATIVMQAELEGVICSGPRKGKQFTYALIAERAPRAVRLSRDEALGELSLRYFRSHGPATVRDFVWWSGLTSADARRGLEINRATQQDAGGRAYWSVDAASSGSMREQLVHLLPIYDEYLIAYRDRDVVPHGPSVIPAARTPITFQHALVVAGQVAGTWRTARTPRALLVNATPLRSLKPRERRALAETVDRYQRFQDVPVDFSVS
jgi:hypothetical protein